MPPRQTVSSPLPPTCPTRFASGIVSPHTPRCRAFTPVIETFPPYPDSMHLQFARGWLELGVVDEAETELGRIRPEYGGCSDALEIRFQILIRRKRFPEALTVAQLQAREYPAEFRGHMNLGNALFWLDRSQEAYDTVVRVLDDHPKIAALPYNLACYCMKLGREDDARGWLETAMKIGQRRGVIQHALADPDLVGLSDYLRSLEDDE